MDNTTRDAGDEQPGHVVVVGQWRKGHARLPLPYVGALRNAGAEPRVFSTFSVLPAEPSPPDLQLSMGLEPDDSSPIEGAVGLVVPGGGDVDPALYGENPHPKTYGVNRRRDDFELTLLAAALERDLPVLAICHGMQILNVHLGGTLDQHLGDTPGRLAHDRPHGPEPVHSLTLEAGSAVAETVGTRELRVNSSHHQGLGTIAPALEPVGWAEDGVLEAVVSTEHSWVVGVQWHPELMAANEATQQGLFNAFVDATREFSERQSVGTRRD
ncbi:MAG TPA: gamma-glutamyl-gamma-aminobutyrate hydrolase family protein [Actinomycetota bacterium]|nr:gamma-glutamyl-gamma-aminobutyrate hydrolase family protein [Actinomycetota bacterium]